MVTGLLPLASYVAWLAHPPLALKDKNVMSTCTCLLALWCSTLMYSVVYMYAKYTHVMHRVNKKNNIGNACL